jgi:glycosyltransferase involved in cell wall biosynthesis
VRVAAEERPLHILVLADRCWQHPQAGGSGANLHGHVEHFLAWGHRVSIITGAYRGGPALERDDALTIHRMGSRSTVFPKAILRQARGLVAAPDVVLEVVNGITFLTPLWLRTPRVALVHHVHRHHYVREMGRAGVPAAFLLEGLPLRALYRRTRFITVSDASARELAATLAIDPGEIAVHHNGVDHASGAPEPRAPEPRLVFLGRLKRYKRVEVLLELLARLPGVHLDIAGEGDHGPALEVRARELALDGRVHFHGFVAEDEKWRLLARAWVHVTASAAEGWGLSVMEAATRATPTVALATGGLTEAIEHDRTGLLATTPDELLRHVRALVEDPPLRTTMGEAARARAEAFSWEATAAQTLALLREVAGAAPVTLPEPVAASALV